MPFAYGNRFCDQEKVLLGLCLAGKVYTEYAVSGRPSGVARRGCREELIAVPKLALGLGSHAGRDTPYKESPRHAGAPPSRLPRPMSAASPRCSGSR